MTNTAQLIIFGALVDDNNDRNLESLSAVISTHADVGKSADRIARIGCK